MSDAPDDWGTEEDDVPPSYTEGMNARNGVGTSPDGRGDLASTSR
ncbi:hypothetical protein [Streptomyces sp. PT12]|nr:hypothetical protein [Streptomyces sp. PT12]